MRRDDRFRSAQQLHADLRATPTLSAGLTSVYRILRILTDQQVVEVQRAEDGEFLYRLRDNDRHHHHLLCRICGRAEEFTLDDLEHHTDRIAGQHRYADVTHHIDLYGTCPECLGGQNDQEPEKYVE
ncbi:MAG: Fe2+/Zn2+ uptake regulation protein [Nocardia sp.]|nr:Fe2+/Zn2+ uptake regulation protein [Nocardia sp.]